MTITHNSIQFNSILYFRHRGSIYIGKYMTRSCTGKGSLPVFTYTTIYLLSIYAHSQSHSNRMPSAVIAATCGYINHA